MHLKVTIEDEFLLTNVTREPSTFIVRPQQVRLELVVPSETRRAVSTRVRLSAGVNQGMILQFLVGLKPHATVATLVWPSVAVSLALM